MTKCAARNEFTTAFRSALTLHLVGLLVVGGLVAGLPAVRAAAGPGPSPIESIAERIQRDLNEPAAGSTETPKKPGESLPRSDSKRPGKSAAQPELKGLVKLLEMKAQQCRTAEEAVLLYKVFIADSKTSADDRNQAQQRLEYWEGAVKDELVRVGKKWIPKPEADKLEAEADRLVAEALELLNLKNFKKADEKLEEASRVYPEHLDSLFLLGLGAFLTDDVRGAERRFLQCLARAPNHVALLNNISVCQIRTKQFASAVKYWEQASSIDPVCQEVVQNLGRFIADANDSLDSPAAGRGAAGSKAGKSTSDFGKVELRTINAATDLYTKLVSSGKVSRADLSRGYIIMGPGKSKGGKPSPAEAEIVGNGSGFVISKGYVLTNRHVVEDADGVVIQDPASPKGELLEGKVLAVSTDLDLAIIECPKLSAPAVPINPAVASRGTEVLALGFPVMSVVGKGLKATRGIVTGLPSKDTGNLMVLDVQINPGNSGGPLCDRSGRVMGIVAAKTFTERFVQGYGLAIPMSDAQTFIRTKVPGFVPAPGGDKPLEWTEVDNRISPSTVLVLIKKKPKKP